ncbi:MAG TPA: hypothetical protein EYH48_03975 [Aquifex aeolicus]|uniref:Uncharacterized protein n=1 Tax=Aquifex aeolicus TaxID=63363 RepID=A0A9D0YPS8_AQUAO|nr:hypothetical protein [Aquificales bacterium]HIP98429.1 hypothetical protein [Aquifex aeolicus]HIQ26468.1 hypothetical protein [Aquifex aeolicus]
MENLELKLLEELSKLEQFGLKNPVDAKAFWKEWQSVFTKVKLSQIAIRTLLETKDLDREEVIYLKQKMNLLRDIETYLKELKEVALQVKGYTLFSPEESEEGNDGDDLDDFLF